MNAKLSLRHSGMSEEGIQELVFALTRSVQQETDLTASPFVPEATGDPGINGDAKGDPVTIGQIFLAALSSGTVVALLQVLKSYVERKPTLRIELETADGRKLKIEAEQLDVDQIQQTVQAVKQLCDKTCDGGND